MSDEQAAVAVTVEALAIAVAYATLGAMRPRPSRVLAVVAAHAVIAGVAFAIAGRGRGILVARAILAAEAIGAAGLGGVAARAVGDAASGAAAAVLVAIAALGALPLVEGARASARVRTVAAAASPVLAAAGAQGIDVLRLPAVYRRSPSAVRELATVSPAWTCLGWALPGAALVRIRSRSKVER